jgi:hypothetical protein
MTTPGPMTKGWTCLPCPLLTQPAHVQHVHVILVTWFPLDPVISKAPQSALMSPHLPFEFPQFPCKSLTVHEGRNVASASGRGDAVPSTVASRREAGELPAAAAHSWHPCLGVGGNSGHGPCKPSRWRLCVSVLRLLQLYSRLQKAQQNH